MWALANKTPYAAERSWWRDTTGAHHWLVAVKATFVTGSDGSLKLADEQSPPLLAGEYYGEPGNSSLRYEADLVHAKPTTDVIVEGSAHAPGGKAVSSVPVGLRVHNLKRKVIEVHGPRVFYRGLLGQLTTSTARDFTTREIRYEGAFGGTDITHPDPSKHRADLRNPIGKGYARSAASLDHQEAHWVEFPGETAATAGPAGFGPIDRHWLPRMRFAGTYDKSWEATQKPLLPTDYDERFAVCAPEDQCTEKPLHGGEKIEIVNMTPQGVWTFELPKIYLTFRTAFRRKHQEHRSSLASVLVNCDEQRVSLVWLSTLRVRARDADYLDETRIGEKAYLT